MNNSRDEHHWMKAKYFLTITQSRLKLKIRFQFSFPCSQTVTTTYSQHYNSIIWTMNLGIWNAYSIQKEGKPASSINITEVPTEFPDCFNPLFNAKILSLMPLQKPIKLCHHSYQNNRKSSKSKNARPCNSTACVVVDKNFRADVHHNQSLF